jgi:HisJ family histidinol phosphate phosphatase
MKFEDWHTHNSLCRHTTVSIENYIRRAIKFDLNVIRISDHFPYEFLISELPLIKNIPYQEYAMTLAEVESYFYQLDNLKEKYKNQKRMIKREILSISKISKDSKFCI